MKRNLSPASDKRDDSPPDPALRAAAIALRELLDLNACRYEPWPFDRLLPRIEPGRIVLPADAVGARSYGSWTPADGTELPLRSRGLQLGRFVLVARPPTTGIALPLADRELALEIAEQCAHALVLGFGPTEGVPTWKT